MMLTPYMSVNVPLDWQTLTTLSKENCFGHSTFVNYFSVSTGRNRHRRTVSGLPMTRLTPCVSRVRLIRLLLLRKQSLSRLVHVRTPARTKMVSSPKGNHAIRMLDGSQFLTWWHTHWQRGQLVLVTNISLGIRVESRPFVKTLVTDHSESSSSPPSNKEFGQ